MNTVTGFVTHFETKKPLPRLSVEVFTVDKFNVIPPIGDVRPSPGENMRLASGVTGTDGDFILSFPDINLPDVFYGDEAKPNPSLLNRSWYNVFVVVKFGDMTLYTSEPRERAGREEFFQILISDNEPILRELDLELSSLLEENEVDILKTTLEADIKREKDLKSIQTILKKEIDDERSKESEKEESFLNPFRNALSRLPDSIRKSNAKFVGEDDSVAKATRYNLSSKILQVFNNEESDKRPKCQGWIALDEAQQEIFLKSEFKNEDGNYDLPAELSQEIYDNILRNNETGESNTTELLYKHPLHQLCKELSAHQKNCMTVLGLSLPDEENQDETKNNEDNQDENASPFDENKDLQQYIDTQMRYVNSPEGPVQFGIGARATLAEIENNVKALSLRPSPADVPAYFDFHSVQIAFEHVWQEAIDEGILDLARDAYDEIVKMGGTPPAPKEDKVSINAIRREARTIARRTPMKKRDLAIPEQVVEEFPSVNNAWARLSFIGRKNLKEYAKKIQNAEKYIKSASFGQRAVWDNIIKTNRQKGIDIIRQATPSTTATQRPESSSSGRPGFVWRDGKWVKPRRNTTSRNNTRNVDEIVNELEEQLKANSYAFTTYAANEKERSVNFGILITYRQRWEPVAYQAGELVKTIPLAPKETRRYNKKVTVKKQRIEKEIENSLQIIKTDSSETGRAESEIIDKATKKTSFQRNSKASSGTTAELVGGKSTTTTNFTGDASRDSRSIKKSFRENVFKAAQEYKNERKVEITTEESFESEFTESGEISNPNDELPVTYMFYELQRRYKVSERIHRLRPVIFVAQEMPKPNEIDEEWILTYDWIIRRILLDDSFLPALNYLGNITSDEFVLAEMEQDVKEQRKLIRDIRISYETIKNETESRYRSLQKFLDEQAGVEEGRDWYDGVPVVGTIENAVEGVLDGIGGLFGFGGGDDEKEAARIRAEAARDAYEKAAQQKKELMTRLAGETDKLQSLSDKYNEKLSDKLQKDVQIARLRVHIKQNILHYMHGIWSHEHPDQRFFRLHNVQVPTLKGEMKLTLKPDQSGKKVQAAYHPGKKYFQFCANPTIDQDYTTLEEVADLDTLLGFKGNYMIFGLKENNALTDYMMAPYVDQELGLKDPDEFGNWTLDEFAQYVCCLKKKLPEEEFNPLIPELTAAYKKLLMDPLRQGEEIIVPTGSLFIEALPGTHSILEDFKLIHRAIDVKKVQAEVREMELENIRLAARLQAGELDDPEMEKKIIVNGDGVNSVDE